MKRSPVRLLAAFFFWFLSCSGAHADTFSLDPSNSSVTFHGSSPIHQFTGVSHEVSGSLEADVPQGRLADGASVSVAVESLRTGIEARDHAVQYTLRAKEASTMTFIAKELQWAGEANAVGERQASLKGELSIGGKTRTVTFPCQVTVQTDTIKVAGHFPLTLSMFGLRPPVFARFMGVHDAVDVDFETLWKKKA